jgi:hypothetical protein
VQTVNAILTLLSATNGSIALESDPSNAAVFLNGKYEGKTPITLDVFRGTYRVVVQKTGYLDWSDRISVTAGKQTDIFAELSAEVTDTPLVTTTVPKTTATKTTLPKKSTANPITPWPTDTPKESPVGIPILLGAVGIGYIVLRKL